MKDFQPYLTNWRNRLQKFGRYATMAFAVLLAIKFGWIEPLNRYRGVAASRATAEALATVTNYPEEYQEKLYVPVASRLELMVPPAEDQEQEQPDSAGRKMVRSARLDLLVTQPSATARRIQGLAESLGGYLVKSYLSGNGRSESAELQIRVPAAKFDDVRTELRKLAVRVISEQAEADDVTKQYVDTRATLLNLRAQETQYREILKRASTVKDAIEVTDKLGSVRREIEKTEAEFKTVSQQVATCSISISLRIEQEFQAFNIRWSPSYEVKFGVRSGLESLAQYLNSMLSFVFHLPAILLWSLTIIAGIAMGWRILKRVLKFVFASKAVSSAPPETK